MRAGIGMLGAMTLACVASGCASTDDKAASPTGDARPLGDIRCTVVWRESNSVPHQPANERILVVSPNENATETLGSYEFHVGYDSDEYEGSSVGIDVGELHWLFQLQDQAPQNQFVGGHGFTGLVYVTHATTQEELQFFCESL